MSNQTKDDMQKKIIQFQILEANLKALQEKAEMLTARAEELEGTRLAMEELKEVKPSKALISLGSGNFVSGRIENTEEVIIGVGSGVAIRKKREDALTILDDSLRETEKTLEEIKSQTMSVALQMGKIQEELEKSQK